MDLKLCRLCCNKEGISNIFDNNTPQISTKIMYCCKNVNIAKDDGLPTFICKECELDLITTYNFVLKCEASDKRLRSRIVIQFDFPPLRKDFEAKIEIKVEDKIISDHESTDEIEYECNNLDETNIEFKGEDEERNISNKKLYGKTNSLDIGTKISYKKRAKSRKSGQYQCQFCSRVCANHSTLVTHMRTHSNEKPFSCLSCDKKYKDSGSLKRHMERIHFRDKRTRNFICEHCGKGFMSKSDVKIHLRTHTGETPYSCPMCPARFTQLSSLLRHKRRHAGEKKHVCPTCNKRFLTNDELKYHFNVHKSEKKYSCPTCNTLFKYQNNLKKHINTHLQPNRFVCNYCGRTFNTKGNLKLHIDRQHSEKSGYCNICTKNVSDIEAHMWRHTGERPLKCKLCTSSFYKLNALAHHMNFRHTNTEKYKCNVEGCNMAFPSKPMLDFHTAKFHDTRIPFPCDRCSRGFYRKNDLARHKIATHKERLDK